jgi:hypothetical protein
MKYTVKTIHHSEPNCSTFDTPEAAIEFARNEYRDVGGQVLVYRGPCMEADDANLLEMGKRGAIIYSGQSAIYLTDAQAIKYLAP